MKRQLLSIPVLIATLILGVYIVPYDATGGIRGAVNAFVNAVRNDGLNSKSSLAPYFGRYGTPGNAVIEIGYDRIRDVQQDKSYSYRVISRTGDGKSFLIEVLDVSPGSNLRNYEYLEFGNPGWMAYFGYSSRDDYYYGRSNGSGSLSKISY